MWQKNSFSFKLAKVFRRKSSGSTNKKKDDASEKASAFLLQENPPIPEIIVVTEISTGLERRIPYLNNETFAGIVNIHYVYDARRYFAYSGPKSSDNNRNIDKEKKVSDAQKQQNREESLPLENVATKANSD